ncbi:MAG: Tfp pilus assembly protein PilF [Maribacter sp.]|jgi:Tfp pilus assembly protein PilF
MNNYNVITVTLFLLFSFLHPSIAQDSAMDFIKKGIKYHDAGKFDQAIDTYKIALTMDKNSTAALYEMSYSYMEKKDYKNAIKYSNKVLKIKKKYMLEAYIINGSALDMMGKTDKGIQVLEKATKEFPNHHLLFFNLGINYSKVNKIDKSIEAFKNAIRINPEHRSSHLFLGELQLISNKKSKAALSYYFFLLLEPDTKRSDMAHESLLAIMNPPKNKSGGFNITLTLDESEDDPIWTSTDLIISMLGTVNSEIDQSLEEEGIKKEEATPEEKFARNTTSFLSMFKEDAEDKKKVKNREKNVYWTLYIPTFNAIVDSESSEALAYYISQNQGDTYIKWLDDNTEKVQELLKVFE